MDHLPSRWTFLLVGIGYSAFLSFLVTGIFLLPDRQRSRVFVAMLIAGVVAALVSAALLVVFQFRLSPSIIRYTAQPVLCVSSAFIAACSLSPVTVGITVSLVPHQMPPSPDINS